MIIDKYGKIDSCLATGLPLRLELGVGNHKVNQGAIGIDRLDTPASDVIGDVIDVLSSLPSNSVSEVYSSHFIEHVDSIPVLLQTLRNCCAPSASITFVAPHFSNPFFWSDPTHKATYGLYSFAYYADTDIFRRSIPSYCRIDGFVLDNVRLGFRSYRPNYARQILKKGIERVANISRWSQELYEECFCWIIPCYEISYMLRVSK